MKFSILLLSVALGAFIVLAEEGCPWHKTDIVFFVDQKDSTGAPVLEQTVKPFLVAFVDNLKKRLESQKNHNVRVAIVTFGGQMVVQHCLTDDQKNETLVEKIKNIKYGPGQMTFKTAFEKCDKADCFKQGSTEYKTDKTFIFFLTDAGADKLDPVKELGKVLSDRNYSVFGIGTGIQGRETEVLKALAKAPHEDHVYNIRDRCVYDALTNEIIKHVNKDQCQKGETPATTTAGTTAEATTVTEATTEATEAPTTTAAATTTEEEEQANQVTELNQPTKLLIAADICFILDASFSLSAPQFEQEKKFALDLMQYIPMGEFGARFATLTFAFNVRIQYNFDDKLTPLDVFKKTKAIPFKAEGATFTDKAIAWARTKVFSGENFQPRHKAVKAAKIAIVITDGAPSRKSLLKKESDLARKDGITILAVGIGSGFAKNKDLLLPMVGGKSENIFIAKQFNELNDKIVEVMDRLKDAA